MHTWVRALALVPVAVTLAAFGLRQPQPARARSAAPWQLQRIGAAVTVEVPVGWRPASAEQSAAQGLPLPAGVSDVRAAQVGVQVWIGAVEPSAAESGLTPARDEGPVLLQQVEVLDAIVRAVRPAQGNSERWATALAELDAEAWELRRDGRAVARVIERRLGGGASAPVVTLVFAPPAAADDDPDGWLKILRSAARSGD
jgi:hypothetical protein